MNDNNVPQTAKENESHSCFQGKHGQFNRKARPLLIDRFIDEARLMVIESDLEISFIESVFEKYKGESPTFLGHIRDVEKLKVIYDYYLERLNFFKNLRDKIRSKEDQRRIEKDVLRNTPENLSVIRD